MSQPLFQPEVAASANLKSLVEPVPAGTVSRTLIVLPGFRQVIFSMDAGQELTEHRSPFTATIQVISGRLDVSVNRKPYPLAADDWLLMPAGAPHALSAKEPTRFLLTLAAAPKSDKPLEG
ncbi:MAG: cupin domain-containing protein [Phycisphaerales bacterium]|nr:cupin domain-containing protein [Phycisphaerales bacterium]